MDLFNPLAAAPFKVDPKLDPNLQRWLDSHGWPVDFQPMTRGHADYWDNEVAPTVRRIEFERLAGLRPQAQPRADAYWEFSWNAMLRVFGVLAHVPGAAPTALKGDRAQLWSVLAPGTNAGPVPIGMLLGVPGFRMPNGAPAGSHHFGWLLTTAPEEKLQEHGIPPTLAMGRVLLDLMIQISAATGSAGRCVLHADPRGGEGLMVFYDRALMRTLDPRSVPKISAKRPNDGRYFYFDEGRAGAFAMALHDFRRGKLGVLPSVAAPVRVR